MALLLAGRFVNPWKRIDFIYNWMDDKKRQDEAIRVMHDFTRTVIEKRRAELLHSSSAKQDILDLDDNDVGIKRRMAFMDVLLLSNIEGRSLTNAEIQEEVDTFMFEVFRRRSDSTWNIIINYSLHRDTTPPQVESASLCIWFPSIPKSSRSWRQRLTR